MGATETISYLRLYRNQVLIIHVESVWQRLSSVNLADLDRPLPAPSAGI